MTNRIRKVIMPEPSRQTPSFIPLLPPHVEQGIRMMNRASALYQESSKLTDQANERRRRADLLRELAVQTITFAPGVSAERQAIGLQVGDEEMPDTPALVEMARAARDARSNGAKHKPRSKKRAPKIPARSSKRKPFMRIAR